MRSLLLAILVTGLLPPFSLAQSSGQTGTKLTTKPTTALRRPDPYHHGHVLQKSEEGYTTILKALPDGFPVPAYSGAELKLADEAVSKQGHQYYAKWYAPSLVADVTNFYVSTMKQSGWKVSDPKGDAGGGASLVCIKPTEGSCRISVSKVVDVVAGKPVQKSQIVVTVHKQ